MGKRLPEVATNDIVTLGPDKSEVGALALITLDPKRYVAEVFQPFRTKLVTLVEASDAAKLAKPDLRTVAGMDIAIKHRAGFRDELRIAGEETRVERKAPLLSIGKLLDSEYREVAAEALPHETYWDGEIKAEEARKKAEKAEKARIEAERVAAIRTKIAEIVGIPAKHAASTSAELTAALQVLATREIEQEEFSELANEARTAVEYVAVELMALRDSATARELAEEQRLAAIEVENKRIAAAAETVRLAAIENARVAGEQAKAAANLEAKQAALAAQVAAHEAAVKLDVDHAEAIEMNALVDAAAVRMDASAGGPFTSEADLARCTATVQVMLANGPRLPSPESFSEHDAMIDADLDQGEVTDEELITMGSEWGMSLPEWVGRLEKFCVHARAELLVAA
jgi:hypothetical protein